MARWCFLLLVIALALTNAHPARLVEDTICHHEDEDEDTIRTMTIWKPNVIACILPTCFYQNIRLPSINVFRWEASSNTSFTPYFVSIVSKQWCFKRLMLRLT